MCYCNIFCIFLLRALSFILAQFNCSFLVKTFHLFYILQSVSFAAKCQGVYFYTPC